MPGFVQSRMTAVLYLLFAVMATAMIWPAQAADETPVYLPKGVVDGVKLIGPPVERGSAAFDTQKAIVLWLQRSRTPKQVAFVSKALDMERFVPILGAELMSVDGGLLTETVDTAIGQVREDYDVVKAFYDVPRPFQDSADVKPVGQDVRPVAAYPSGHAIRATVYARLLAHVFPEKADALVAFANQVGYGRVIAGVHYPEDVVAGQKLGNAYADVIVRQPAFNDAVARIREQDATIEAAQ